jgi:hypothetical protein
MSFLEPKVTTEKGRAEDTDTKWRRGCQAFVLVLFGTLAGPSEESVTVSKSSF